MQNGMASAMPKNFVTVVNGWARTCRRSKDRNHVLCTFSHSWKLPAKDVQHPHTAAEALEDGDNATALYSMA